MGQNLTTLVWKDSPTKGQILADDARNARIFGLLWAGSVYGIAMIWWAMALLARWDRNRETGAGSVLGAFLLATAWPVVMIYLLLNPV
ncbi:hypothetical protein MAPG_01918 [Magnaporthiopsis poae ATCC 64411]|uniref:Uncharacterized protein n=1 Tax=Magnaporthiopsis poae (strain ATCC 64411 / 73-15) TaxID=644358 RepID=A0A0C4DPY7_MAGP6|nr:hypothetical protein MAPG_01918 [Magnaporthiopsis poae ATCC 64411]